MPKIIINTGSKWILKVHTYISMFICYFLLLSELHFIIKIERIQFAESSSYEFSINILLWNIIFKTTKRAFVYNNAELLGQTLEI